jgi:hypothetical protein
VGAVGYLRIRLQTQIKTVVQEVAVLDLLLLPGVPAQPDKEILEVLACIPHQIMVAVAVAVQAL